MKKYYLLPLLAISLTSCSSPVSFETFKSKAQDAVKKEHEFTSGKASAKGEYVIESTQVKVDEEYSYKYNSGSKSWNITDTNLSNDVRAFIAILVDSMLNSDPTEYASKETEGVKYYASNSGLKIVDASSSEKNSSLSFNSYGLVTEVDIKGSQDSNKIDFTVKYSYSK